MNFSKLAQTENDTSLTCVVGRHFHLHAITHNKADKALSHLTRNMSQHFVPAGKSHFKHRSCENRRDRAFDFDRLVFTFFFGLLVTVQIIATSPATSTASSAKISWLSDNEMGYI